MQADLHPSRTERLSEFECRRCNQCCMQPGFVYLKEADLPALAAGLGLTEFDFVNAYCDLENRRRLVLKKKANEHCVFLTEAGCSVYAARPAQCRDFPRAWRTARSFDYCEGLKALARS